MFKSKRDFLFLLLAGFFITNAIVAELISCKLISIGPFTTIVGVIPWPIVFLATDIINEFYGKKAVRQLSILTSCLIGYAFIVVFMAMNIKAHPASPTNDAEFNKVFGQSLWVIVGSITAFLVSQVLDVYVFWFVRERTGMKFIWMRSTVSTLVSQLIDSFVVLGIGFWLPGRFTFNQFIEIGLDNYMFKILIAIGLTPFIYIVHKAIEKYLGDQVAHDAIKHSAEDSLAHKVAE
jgi:queuosine precursor transporter